MGFVGADDKQSTGTREVELPCNSGKAEER